MTDKIKTENVYKSVGKLTESEVGQLKALLQAYPLHNHDGRNTLAVATKKVRASMTSEKVIAPTDLVAGERISNGNAIRVSSTQSFEIAEQLVGGSQTSTGAYVVDTSASYGNLSNYTGGTPVQQYGYQSFKIENADSGSGVGLKKFVVKLVADGGTPTATINFQIETDSSGSPSGTAVSGSSGSGSISLGSNPADFTVTYSTPVELSTDTTYWLKFWNSENSAATTPILVGSQNANSRPGVYSNGHYAHYGSETGSYVLTHYNSDDIYFELYWIESSGKIFKASSITTDLTSLYLGISNNDGTSGSTVNVITNGFKTDFDSLTQGATYYLTDTAGEISTTAGTYSAPIGRGITDKILLIQPPALI